MSGETRTVPSREYPSPTDGNGAACPWLATALDQLAAIRQLPPGWDSHGADAPIKDIVDTAERLLKRLCQESPGWSPPHVHPTRSGGVQFEWELSGRYFEIEVDADGTQFFFQDESAGIERTGELGAAGTLAALIGSLLR
jgi:hypothetical protein